MSAGKKKPTAKPGARAGKKQADWGDRMAAVTDDQLWQTWQHLLANNLEQATVTPNGDGSSKESRLTDEQVARARASALSRSRDRSAYPKKECMQTSLQLGRNRTAAEARRKGDDRARKRVQGLPPGEPELQLYVHQLAAFVGGGRPERGNNNGQKMTASHLCANTVCCNPNHVVWEHYDVNRTRYCCELALRQKVNDYRCPHDVACVGFDDRRCNSFI